MRVINRTHWRTDHLRAFAKRVALDELDPAKRKHVVVTFEYTRGRGTGGYSSGHATYGGTRCTVRLSPGTPLIDRIKYVNGKVETRKWDRSPSKVDLAGVLAHEFAHLRGVRHQEMHNSRYNGRYNGHRTPEMRAFFAWAQALPLELKPGAIKPLVTPETKAAKLQARRAQKLAAAERLALQWAKRAVLAQRRSKRWAQRARTLRAYAIKVERQAATPKPVVGDGSS